MTPLSAGVTAAAGILLAVCVGFWALNWKVTFSPEPSLGHYVFLCNENKPDGIRKGDKVAFPFPVDTPYYRKGQKFLKTVACVAGETLTVDERKRYFCEGEWIGTARDTDVHGKPVGHFVFSGRIPEGMAFAAGTHPRSYDSKYWGLLDLSTVTGRCYGY